MGVELIYFDIHGRGFMPRLVLAAAGIKFTDTRVTFAQLAEMKKTLPLGQIPVLKTDKLVINQSGAILNWAVRNGDLPKLTDAEATKSDVVAETCKEIVERVSGPAFAAMQIVDQSKKEERSAKFREVAIAKLLEELPKVEKILKHVGAAESGIAPGKITLGDLHLLNIGHLAYDLGQLDSLPACHRSIAKTLRKDKRITAFLDQERDNKIKFYPF